MVCAAKLLQVSPFLPDVLLSVGDWSFKLWQGVESKVPVFVSPYADEAYSAGRMATVLLCLLNHTTSASVLDRSSHDDVAHVL